MANSYLENGLLGGRCEAVNLADGTDLPGGAAAIYVGGTGHVSIMDLDGNIVLFKNAQAGSTLPVRVRRVRLTATTASDLVAVY